MKLKSEMSRARTFKDFSRFQCNDKIKSKSIYFGNVFDNEYMLLS